MLAFVHCTLHLAGDATNHRQLLVLSERPARRADNAVIAQARPHRVDPWAGISNDDPPSTPDETASLLRRVLHEIRPTVEPQTWNAFWNTAVLGRSAPDVADELGLTPAAVRQAKSRMLRRLRRQLGDR